MEMQQIRYFLTLARTLSFTRAAEECNVSQSAMTRAIQTLEAELGGELIRREGVWRAQQLASSRALSEALRGSFAESRAAFGLWLAAPARSRDDLGVETDLWRVSSPAPADMAMAAGAGGLGGIPRTGLR